MNEYLKKERLHVWCYWAFTGILCCVLISGMTIMMLEGEKGWVFVLIPLLPLLFVHGLDIYEVGYWKRMYLRELNEEVTEDE